MSRKAMLEHQIRLAFAEDDEMSLLASIWKCGDEVMGQRLNGDAWSVGEILYHVAACKFMYCAQGWGGENEAEVYKPLWDLDAMRGLLARSHARMLECLASLGEEDLDKPLPLAFHGESAHHFFSVMAIHDVSHGAQIRATLRACGMRK